jgi:hypothetical protein
MNAKESGDHRAATRPTSRLIQEQEQQDARGAMEEHIRDMVGTWAESE